jgi:hypothetical protein
MHYKTPGTNEKDFHQLIDKDVCKLMNVCNRQMCNPTCYKSDVDVSKKNCKFGFLQTLINKTHGLLLTLDYYILTKQKNV